MNNQPWYTRLAQALLTDRPQEATIPTQESRPAKKASSIVKRIGLVFTSGTGQRRDYQPPEYDLHEVARAYNTESYVRQAIDKYVDLMFKQGWTLEGRNTKAVEYVKMRLQLISVAIGVPIEQFFTEIAEDLVKYHNVFIVKARARKAEDRPRVPSGRVVGLDGKEPIAGYFILNPTTMEISRDFHGNVLGYQQDIPTNPHQPIEFKPEDIIHIAYKRERGFAFGMPFLISVIDDIKALREAEENVLRLIYKHIFPFHIYQIGLPEPGFEATDEEIEDMEQKLGQMNLDAGLVLPERHNVKVVGLEGEALKAENYLKYFEQRVFTGLGVSEVQMGRGASASRSTADAMTIEMHDRVKAFQRCMALFIDEKIINELLMEGGFDHITKPDDDVDFIFKEIELESMIKAETHAVYLYEHNAITEDEMREMMGREPITERGLMYANLVDLPKITAGQGETTPGTKETDNKQKPSNQHGTRSGPKKRSEALQESQMSSKLRIAEYRSMLDFHWELTKDDTIDLVRHYYISGQREFSDFNPKELQAILYLTVESMLKIADKFNRASFMTGINDAMYQTAWTTMPQFNFMRYIYRLNDDSKQYISKLMEDLASLAVKTVRSANATDAIAKVVGAYAALSYRLDSIANTSQMKAYNYGFAVSGQVLDRDEASVVAADGHCRQCTQHTQAPIKLKGDFYGKIPPFHPNCVCTLRLPSLGVTQ